ncbi:ABC transporter permease [Hyalangium versicolor]|uniref:ABC transporter permease n=1 Tax=Hyalangium versicolor TaxID=2861190 RepID=UPI001CD008C7|nr:ABC transporter permease [Hyalangium versicolor]
MSRRPEAGWRRYLRFWGSNVRADVDEELRYHLESCAEELMAKGMSREAAQAEALRRFGDLERIRRECEEESGAREQSARRAELWDSLWQDVRYALRSLRRSPGFLAAAVLTLALSIGANTAIFSIVEGVLLKPLPYPHPERLVALFTRMPGIGADRFSISQPELEDFRQARDTFSAFSGLDWEYFNVSTGEGEPERLAGVQVEASMFEVLGVVPSLGRRFTAEEDVPGKDQVVVVTHGFWKRRLGANPAVIGSPLWMDGVSRTIIGVLPEDFEFRDAQFLVPLALGPLDPARRSAHSLGALGRLAPGVTLEQAQTALSTLAGRLVETYPEHYPTRLGFDALVISLREQWVGGVSEALLLLLGAVLLVQLIACANVANLLLARGEARQHELAVRTALGASRWRIVRQLLTESLVLGVGGGLGGLMLAQWGVDALLALADGMLPRATQAQVDLSALGVTMGIAIVSGLAFGLLPALQATRSDPREALQGAGKGFTAGLRRLRARNVLVVTEVALAVTLVAGAGLLLRSFWALSHVEPGFDAERVLTLDLSLPSAQYEKGPQVARFYRELLERLRAVPGVESVAATSGLPMGGSRATWDVDIEGQTLAAGEVGPSPNFLAVTPDYFRAMGIRVMKGRNFSAEDDGPRLEVAVVNELAARAMWPGEDPLGKRFRVRSSPGREPFPWMTVIGVVANVRAQSLKDEARAEYYLLHGPLGDARDAANRAMTVVLRTSLSPTSLAEPARRTVRELDSKLAVANVRTLEQVAMRTASRTRFTALLLALFGGAGILLAAVGIYGVLAFTVVQRTREMGVRIALGASRASVLRLVVGQGLRLTAVGLALGVGVALGMGYLLRSMLFGVSAADPLTFLGVVTVLGAVALLSSYLPARRATGVDPVTALRSD